MRVKLSINGDPVEVNLKSADRLLLDVLREDLQLTGTKHGCGIGACGTCTVIMDGYPIASCLQLAALCDGSEIRTIEGLAGSAALHTVQQAFVNRSALQCGICIPGHVMAAVALLEKNPDPSAEEIRASADSVYCRCTGYVRILEA
ncbi:MAG TPA: (2Fe-2S)-binding protein, partial [Burkholderiales bacterium]|nr:(2Fe-2S)-binding protein [Burkholderiales bacterium]